MAEHSSIEWTDATWNPITGCSVVSPGCTNCYAMKLAGTRLQHHPSRAGLTSPSKAGPVWNGQVRLNEAWLTQPLKWKTPRRIFVCAHGDLFHEAVPDEWILRVLEVIRQCSWDGGSNIGSIAGGGGEHTFQILTKRSRRMREVMSRLRWDGERLSLAEDGAPPIVLRNVWLGVSAENQKTADERIRNLLNTPAAVRFVSAEPLLGPVDLRRICILPQVPGGKRAGIHLDSLFGRYAESGMPYKGDWDITNRTPPDIPAIGIDWVIAGGESGPDARPMHPAWASSLRDQCQAAGVPFFFKQWGEWSPFGSLSGPQTVVVNDGTRYAMGDLAYPDGPRRGEALRAGHEHANLTIMYRVGKKSAGRLLDGVEHDAMPEARRHG